ncbi:hypothetical protein V2W45_1239049, partial [Cenococcum geophilum]
LKLNIKEGAFRYIIKLLIDFYNDKSFIEVIEVINLGEQFINFVDYLLFNIMPSIINIITIIVYLSHFINRYIGLIIIAVVVL